MSDRPAINLEQLTKTLIKKLISSFTARPGDVLVAAVDLKGEMHPQFPFWNAATQADPIQLREKYRVLCYLAENNLCDAGKDISMGGIIGTLLMLIEASRCGAVLDLDSIVYPIDTKLEVWLLCFPSCGFLLSIRPENLDAVAKKFSEKNISCSSIGKIVPGDRLTLKSKDRSHLFWDFKTNALISNTVYT